MCVWCVCVYVRVSNAMMVSMRVYFQVLALPFCLCVCGYSSRFQFCKQLFCNMFSDAHTSFFLLKLSLAIQGVLQHHMNTIFFLFTTSVETAIVYNFDRDCTESSDSVLILSFLDLKNKILDTFHLSGCCSISSILMLYS